MPCARGAFAAVMKGIRAVLRDFVHPGQICCLPLPWCHFWPKFSTKVDVFLLLIYIIGKSSKFRNSIIRRTKWNWQIKICINKTDFAYNIKMQIFNLPHNDIVVHKIFINYMLIFCLENEYIYRYYICICKIRCIWFYEFSTWYFILCFSKGKCQFITKTDFKYYKLLYFIFCKVVYFFVYF